jgi:hypothetical protein
MRILIFSQTLSKNCLCGFGLLGRVFTKKMTRFAPTLLFDVFLFQSNFTDPSNLDCCTKISLVWKYDARLVLVAVIIRNVKQIFVSTFSTHCKILDEILITKLNVI